MWKKTTSTYVANWKTFSLTPRSVGQLAVVGAVLGFVWSLLVVMVFGLPGSEARAADKKWNASRAQATENAKEICRQFPASSVCKQHQPQREAAATAIPKGSCIANYNAWSKMPEGPQKAAKLVYWKKAYGSLNFHDNCAGEPRSVPAADVIQ